MNNLHTDAISGETAAWYAGDRKEVWHHLGQYTPEAKNLHDVKRLAHLTFNAYKHPLFARPEAINGKVQPILEIPDKVAIFRDDTGAYLGTVGDGYTVIQIDDMFSFVDDVLRAEAGAHYSAAGALGKGERVWIAAAIPQSVKIHGTQDEHKSFLMFVNAFDGSMNGIAKLVDTRPVRQNTISIALGESGSMFRFRHTKNVQARMQAAKDAWTGITQEVERLNAKLNTLAARKVTRETYVAIMDRLFPINKDAEFQTRRDNLLAAIAERYEYNDNNAIPEIQGTAYNLLNAVTEYTDHLRTARLTEGRKADGYTIERARAENAVFDSGAKLKTDALNVILELTATAPPNRNVGASSGIGHEVVAELLNA